MPNVRGCGSYLETSEDDTQACTYRAKLALMSSAADKAETNKIAIKTAKDEETESPIDKVGADDEDRALIRSFAPQGLGDFGGGGGGWGRDKATARVQTYFKVVHVRPPPR